MLNQIPARKRTYSKRLIALGLAVTVGFSAIAGWVLWENRDRDREEARRSAANLTATLSSEIARNLELYDLSLQGVVDGLKLPDLPTIEPSLRQIVLFDRAATAKDMGSILVLDGNGTVTIDSRTLTPRADNYAHSDFFMVHKQTRDAGLYVSRSWVAADGEYLIAISRRLENPDGSFAGVVAGTLRLSYFHKLFHNLKLGEKDALAVFGRDAEFLMRFPFDIDQIGRQIRRSPLFNDAAELPSGTFEGRGIDGEKRMFVFQRIAATPLVVSYGVSIDAIFADWRGQAWRIGALMLALCGINIALVVFLANALKRRSEAEYQLALAAKTDGLTGLLNRRSLDQAFHVEWRRAMRSQSPLSMLMIDADKFKRFNDQFGHQAGDAALIRIAHCIEDSARRATDVSARYGGEEFAVLLPDTSGDDALLLAEMIRSKIAGLRAADGERPDRIPTISVGVASLVPQPGLQPGDLIKAADSALYEAKISGRNCCLLAEVEIDPDWTKWSVDPDVVPPERETPSPDRRAA